MSNHLPSESGLEQANRPSFFTVGNLFQWRWLRFFLWGLGGALIVISLLVNQWLAPRFLNIYTSGDPVFIERQVQILHQYQAVAFLAGLMLVFHRWVLAGIEFLLQTRVGRFLFVRPDPRLIVAVCPLVIVLGTYWIMACERHEVPLMEMMTIASFLKSAVVTALLFLLLAAVLMKLIRWKYASVIAALPWAILIPIETIMYYYGNTRFEFRYLNLAAEFSIRRFISTNVLIYLVFCVALCLLTGFLAAKQVQKITWKGCARFLVFIVLLLLINVTYITFWISRGLTLRAIDRMPLGFHRSHLEYIKSGSLVHFIAMLLPNATNYHEIRDWQAFQEPIEFYHLQLNNHHYKPLGQKPFRRIILILTESIDLCFLRSFNADLPGPLMPFFDSPEFQENLLINHRTSVQPTIPALAAIYCSHPNWSLVKEIKYQQSFVNILRRHGWRTAYFNPVPKSFGDQGIHATQAGFMDVICQEKLLRGQEDAAYNSGWGLCDRILFRLAKEYLLAHFDQPVFLSIETADTHTPNGREDYADLDYPPTPEWIHQFPHLAPFLQAVFRSDYDIKLFLSELMAAGLYDQNTLVIITSDHCWPSSPTMLELPGTSSSPFERIPFTLLSPRILPAFRRQDTTSQLDVAPSVLHLLNLPIPAGYWGDSIFDIENPPAPFVGVFRNTLTIETEDFLEVLNLDESTNPMQDKLRYLLNSYSTDTP